MNRGVLFAALVVAVPGAASSGGWESSVADCLMSIEANTSPGGPAIVNGGSTVGTNGLECDGCLVQTVSFSITWATTGDAAIDGFGGGFTVNTQAGKTSSFSWVANEPLDCGQDKSVVVSETNGGTCELIFRCRQCQ